MGISSVNVSASSSRLPSLENVSAPNVPITVLNLIYLTLVCHFFFSPGDPLFAV